LICDRVAILLRGRLKAMGHMNELLSRRVNEWEIQFSGAPTETVEAWAPRLKKLIRSQEEFLAIATEEDLAREIIRTVVEKGGTLLQVTPRRQTLEDYFLAEVAAGGDA
jgi:ABC-2 type transport system ATP-binding protein